MVMLQCMKCYKVCAISLIFHCKKCNNNFCGECVGYDKKLKISKEKISCPVCGNSDLFF